MITKTYEELFTFQALYRAHLRARKCKRDKKPLVRFEMITLSHLTELSAKLDSGKFKFSKYASFIVEEPKRREIQTLPYDNRIVQHILCDDLMTPYFSARTILDNCACQNGKGMHFALTRFEKMIHAHIRKHGVKGYFLKCDILKYFPSMPHDRLKEIFCPHIQDEKVRALIVDVIDSYSTRPNYLAKYGIDQLPDDSGGTGRGVPIGNQTSQLFGMYYLDKVDRLVKEKLRIKTYSRYMDDFVLLHEDKDYVNYAYREIGKAIAALGLQFNSKTQIFPIKNGVTYLGFRYIVMPSGKVIKTIKKIVKRRLRWRARLLKKAYLDNLIPLERVEHSKVAFHGHLKHANCYKLERELYAKLNFTKDEEKGEKEE